MSAPDGAPRHHVPVPDGAPRLLAPARRALLDRRVRWIVAATITDNVIEAWRGDDCC